MKRFLAVASVVLALAFPALTVAVARPGSTHHSSSSSTKPKVHVKGYYRKDGTYVAPHDRTAPGGAPSTSSPKPPSTTSPKTPSASTPASPHSHGCKTCPR